MTMIFPRIERLQDVLPHIEHKREIMLMRGAGDSYILCYLFMDSSTFDTPLARECRGIAFDREGRIVARPLHKFFNVGEKEHTAKNVLPWHEATRVMDKLDGSMIHTAWMYDQLWFKSKKSFSSSVVLLARAYLDRPEKRGVAEFCARLARDGYTAIFEITGPEARIVVPYPATELRLLHIRHTVTGAYVPLAEFRAEIDACGVATVAEFAVASALPQIEALESANGTEGYVVQFRNGEMVKAKCPWYLRLHRSLTLMRRRDIAEAALAEQLDDLKAALVEVGSALAPVEAIETAVKNRLLETKAEVDRVLGPWRGNPDRKSVALALKGHPLFGLIMHEYTGKQADYRDWYRKNRLREEWSLDPVEGYVESDT